MWNKLIITLSSIALCAAASGCFVVEPAEPSPAAEGTLTTGWTLDGSTDANACAYFRVDFVHVVIVDDAGFVILDEEPNCKDFELSVDLSTGRYSSEVTLLDFRGYAVSDTFIADALVARDTETFVDFNFPDASIL
jgi:hypothetical protein